jgi:hypothetical protein
MMNAKIELMRSASSWILHPTRLIDRFLDRLETLSAVLAVPAEGAGLSYSEAPIVARWPLGVEQQRAFSLGR